MGKPFEICHKRPMDFRKRRPAERLLLLLELEHESEERDLGFLTGQRPRYLNLDRQLGNMRNDEEEDPQPASNDEGLGSSISTSLITSATTSSIPIIMTFRYSDSSSVASTRGSENNFDEVDADLYHATNSTGNGSEVDDEDDDS